MSQPAATTPARLIVRDDSYRDLRGQPPPRLSRADREAPGQPAPTRASAVRHDRAGRTGPRAWLPTLARLPR